MPLVTGTISGQFLQPDLGPGKVTVWIEATSAGSRLTYSGQVISGRQRVEIDTNGNASVSLPLLPQAGVAPTEARWRIVWHPSAGAPEFFEFTFTGDTTWDALVDVSGVPITSSLVTQAEQARDAAVAAAAGVATSNWQASTAYVAGQIVRAPDGSTISRNSSGTSRASFDATEQSVWTVVAVKSGTLEKAALDATYTPVKGTTQHPLTGMFHADAFGDKTLKTSNVNLAIAAANAVGSVVYMRAGSWTCDDPINASNTQVLKILGAGRTLTRVAINSASSFGFLEAVGSVGIHIEGIGFTMGASGSAQYGILAGRSVGDASVPHLKLKDIEVVGKFTLAACFVLNAEQAHYEDCKFWADQGAGLVLARDQRNFSTVTAKWTAISTTSGYAGGNGVIRLERVQCLTTRTLAAGPTDYPLVVEYAQTFTADSLYTVSAGPHLIVLDKRTDEVTINGLQQEFSGAGATEPYGIYAKNTLTGTENRTVRLNIEGSSIYSIFGEDNVKFTSLKVKASGFRATTKSFNCDVYSADLIEVPVGGGNYTAISTSEQTTPTYNRRDGNPLVIMTPMGVLRASTSLDFPSIASGGVSSLTMTVTGARTGDPCHINVNPGGLSTGIVLTGGVSANDTVTVKAQNCTAAAIDPAAVTVIATVLKFS